MMEVAGFELMVELKTRRQTSNFPGAAFHNIVSTPQPLYNTIAEI